MGTIKDRIMLWILIFCGIVSVLWFADFWFLSETKRHPIWFPLLSLALFWGVYRSIANWMLYYFISPEPTDSPEILSAERPTHAPTVDVFTTAMPGEPFEMFAETLRAIQNIQTPHQTFLLDGGNDEALIKLCQELHVTHVNCQEVQGAKAGKINYCLKHYSTSEIVFIIDPDHRPKPDLLHRVLPFFRDPHIGFVQVVQAYYNGSQSFVAEAADEQTFGFYGPTLMALNGLEIPTAIGANCIFRRKALDSIQGHAEHLAEDALTSMRIHAKGWKSVYYPYRGTEGLVPEDLGTFFKQQYKWTTGMFYLLFHEYFRLFKSFNWKAKIHYFNAGTFYFGGVASFLTLFFPIFLLLSRQYAVEFDLIEFFIHLFPYSITTFFTYIYLQRYYTHEREKRLPWRSMVLEKSTWHIYVMGFLSALLQKKVQYFPTPKNSDRSPMPLLVLPNLLIIALSIWAVIFGFVGYPNLEGGTALMIIFALLNILLLIPITAIAIIPQWNWRRSHAKS